MSEKAKTPPNEAPATLDSEHVWYTIQPFRQKKPKIILRDVSVSTSSGQVLAIMGPSGAGKTMFLNCLTLQRGPGKRYGTVRLNGHVFTNQLFRWYCSIVTQMDIHWPFLTCRQQLNLAASLFMREGAAHRQEVIEDLCRKSGMLDCLDTRIGNQFIPGLAFGQRRRLSLMVALLKRPVVVFLDEPTTNLDSASAAGIMAHLKVIAAELNIIVVCTIHQPDKNVFAGFDSLLLLSEGRIAYKGSAASASDHFASLGKEVPMGANPADFFLDLMNKSFTDPEIVDMILDEWSSRTAQFSVQEKGILPDAIKLPNCAMQIMVLFRRHSLLFVRDPSLYLGRMVMIVISTCFFALCYVESRDRNQEQVLNRMWLMLWCLGVPANLSLVATFALNLEFVNIRFEVASGMYSFFSYVIAHTMVQLPAMILQAICATSIAGYCIGNWNAEKYFPMILVYALSFWSFECVAQFCSIGKSHPLLGLMDYLNYWFGAFAFSGFFVRPEDVVWPLRALVYILPMRYTVKVVSTLEVIDTEYEGAVVDDSIQGFNCPGIPTGSPGCYGRTGKQVLGSVGNYFFVFEADADVLACLLAIFGSCIVFKLIYVAVGCIRLRSVAPPAPLPAEVHEKLQRQIEESTREKDLPKGETSNPTVRQSSRSSVRGSLKNDLPVKVGETRLVFSVEKAWSCTKKKELLKNVSFSVESGELLAIMGPSGAGKTLVLNSASLVKGAKMKRYGTVKLNSVPFSAPLFSKYASQIVQTDSHWPFLTPREELKMTVDMYSGKSGADKAATVNDLLYKMGLEGCQNTRIGNQFVPGCSGGQRRRTSIAIAMAKSPLLLILDEPTAGLDAAAAWSIIMTVKEHALLNDIIVMCTLSQPSVEIFVMIDNLVLLSEGSVAYSGRADRALGYFSSIGQSPSPGENPAEFLVGLLNRGFMTSQTVDEVLKSWPQKEAEFLLQPDPEIAARALPPFTKGPNCLARIGYLMKRHALLVVRDPTMYTGRALVNIIVVAFFGLIYVESRQAIQQQVMSRYFHVVWGICVPFNLVVIAVFAHQIELTQVIAEIRSGMYGASEYLVAQFCLQILLIPLVVIGNIVLEFAIANWPWDYILQYWFMYVVAYLGFEALAQALAVRPVHVLINMMDCANFWFVSFLFCGMLLPQDFVIWPIRLFTYVSPFRYLLQSSFWMVFMPAEYEGAASDITAERGFVCDSSVPIGGCFGPRGCDILDSTTAIFEVSSCEDRRGRSVLVLAILIAVFKALFALGLFGRCQGLKPLRPYEAFSEKKSKTEVNDVPAAVSNVPAARGDQDQDEVMHL